MSLKNQIKRYLPLFTYAPVALGPALNPPADLPSQRRDDTQSESASHDDEGEREDFSATSTGAPTMAGVTPGTLDVVDFSPLLSGGGAFDILGATKPPERGDDRGLGTAKLILVGAIQPRTPVGPLGRGTSNLRGLALIAAPGRRAILGGMPLSTAKDEVPAPMLIEDSVLDAKIELGANVQIGRNVTMVDVTYSVGGVPKHDLSATGRNRRKRERKARK